MPSKVQSLLFSKKHYTKSQAMRWLREHNFKCEFGGKGPDITDNYIRFRQRRPKKDKEYRTITFRTGILAIIEI